MTQSTQNAVLAAIAEEIGDRGFDAFDDREWANRGTLRMVDEGFVVRLAISYDFQHGYFSLGASYGGPKRADGRPDDHGYFSADRGGEYIREGIATAKDWIAAAVRRAGRVDERTAPRKEDAEAVEAILEEIGHRLGLAVEPDGAYGAVELNGSTARRIYGYLKELHSLYERGARYETLRDPSAKRYSDEEVGALVDALYVFVRAPALRRWLRENDPKALAQAEEALAGSQIEEARRAATCGLCGETARPCACEREAAALNRPDRRPVDVAD